MKMFRTSDLVVIAALGGLAYWLYTKAKATVAASTAAIANAPAAAASGIVDIAEGLFGSGIAQPGQSYTVTMADGTVQTVPYGQLPTPVGVNGLGTYPVKVRRRRPAKTLRGLSGPTDWSDDPMINQILTTGRRK